MLVDTKGSHISNGESVVRMNVWQTDRNVSQKPLIREAADDQRTASHMVKCGVVLAKNVTNDGKNAKTNTTSGMENIRLKREK